VSQKTALVTGAASGIGFGIAKHLVAEGFTVWVSDIRLDLAQQAAETNRRLPCRYLEENKRYLVGWARNANARSYSKNEI